MTACQRAWRPSGSSASAWRSGFRKVKWGEDEDTMKAVLVRHGETEHNANGIFQGYSPVPLSVLGRQQATLVAERLVSIRPQVLYSSDLRRAQESADIISQKLGL